MARGGQWLKELPVVVLGLRLHPDHNGSCCISTVTGEQPVVPPVVAQCGDMMKVSKALSNLSFPYKPTRQRVTKEHRDKRLATCEYVWLRLDRVRMPLEAPYQGPFKVLRRTAATFTIEVKGKPQVVAIERVKPAAIPDSLPSTSITCLLYTSPSPRD